MCRVHRKDSNRGGEGIFLLSEKPGFHPFRSPLSQSQYLYENEYYVFAWVFIVKNTVNLYLIGHW